MAFSSHALLVNDGIVSSFAASLQRLQLKLLCREVGQRHSSFTESGPGIFFVEEVEQDQRPMCVEEEDVVSRPVQHLSIGSTICCLFAPLMCWFSFSESSLHF